MERTLANEYKEKLKVLENSELIQETIRKIDTTSVTNIRCLGLGSIASSLQAMYQLCFLSLIKEYFENGASGDKINVTLWDPVFHKDEITFMEKELNYKIDENESSDASATLYYMPHFPIVAFENIITSCKPRYILGNNLIIYTFKFSDSKYFELYPNCARITKLILDKQEIKSQSKQAEDGFQLVSKKKNTRRKQYVPKVVDYHFESAYFTDVNAVEILEGNNLDRPWAFAFTDLAFFKISIESK